MNRITGYLLSLLIVVLAPAFAYAQDDSGLLAVEDAFKLDTQVLDRGQVKLHWAIADGYYLYRNRIKVKTDQAGVSLGALALPDGERKNDEFLGEVEVYHHTLTGTLPVTVSDATLAQLEIKLTIQGCHELEPKICYPPYTRTITLDLPPPASPIHLGSDPGLLNTPAATVLPLSNDPTGGLTEELPLPPEDAFRFEAIATSPTALLARFTMAKGYYLYRDKTRVVSITAAGGGAAGISTPILQWPAGVKQHDDHFGEVEVYFDLVEVPLSFKRTDAKAQQLKLAITMQGCELDGICYPPMPRVVEVSLPVASADDMTASAGSTVSADAAPVSEQDRFADSLKSGNRLFALFAFFLVGIGLAFTPCVLPMVPILSGIIAGAGENLTTRRALWLSTVYVLASAVVFTIAGVIAGIAGQNLQAILQKPAVLSAFAALFVVLSFSMFGFYELQMPAWLQNRVNSLSNRTQGGSTLGVAIMGLLSALLVGPCVAPPLAGAVLYISQQRDPFLGGAALFSMALGMGLPLVAFGASAGKLMPRAGAWMDAVKAVFGVVFLWLAIWMLERVVDPQWIMLLAGMLLVASGVYLGALDRLAPEASGWRKLWKALGFAMLIFGVLQFIGLASGGRDYLRPLGGLHGGGTSASTASVESLFAPVGDAAQLDAAIAAASAQGKPVLFDFYADWCTACKEMERYTFTDPAIQASMRGFVALKIDVTDQNEAQVALQQRFGIIGPPATLFFSCSKDENKGLRLIGFEAASAFGQRLQQASRC